MTREECRFTDTSYLLYKRGKIYQAFFLVCETFGFFFLRYFFICFFRSPKETKSTTKTNRKLHKTPTRRRQTAASQRVLQCGRTIGNNLIKPPLPRANLLWGCGGRNPAHTQARPHRENQKPHGCVKKPHGMSGLRGGGTTYMWCYADTNDNCAFYRGGAGIATQGRRNTFCASSSFLR